MTEPLLAVRDLKMHFRSRGRVGKAVNGVSFNINRGETLGLVGESGSGKTQTALSILGLHARPAGQIVGGEILYRGVDLAKLSQRQLTRYRGKRIAMILQDPMTALNPVLKIGEQVSESLRMHQRLRGRSLKQRAAEMLGLLQIPDPAARLNDYPHVFSGGMRQRVVGAIALSCEPELLIADEPTTALDVTIQAAYLSLLRDLQAKSSLAILFITHDFGVVSRMCDRVAIMYAGRIVEAAETRRLFTGPAHPYSEALLRSVPDLRRGDQRLISIEGQPPSIFDVPAGCPFAPRCPYVMARCREEYPPEVTLTSGHTVQCWRHV